jgi:hypothetical protein
VPRRLTLIVVSGLGALAALAASSALASDARPAPTARVLGSDAISARSVAGSYTVILGRVGLQTSGTLQAVHLPGDPFPWWAKSGLEVARGSSPVVISIPAAWRSRVAIGWNNRGGAEAAVERVDACSASAWLAYPGGFHVTAKGCVPVDVSVGSRHQRVYVAVGSRAGCAGRR